MKKLMVLDGHSIAFRAFHAVPELVTAGGIYTNALYGFVNMLIKITQQYKPNAVAVAFDLKEPTFRHKMFDGYKAGRSATPEQLLSQIELLKELLTKMGVTVLSVPGFEADDNLGTLSKLSNDAGYRTYLVTGDRDSLQLIGSNTTVLYTKKGVSTLVEYTTDVFKEEYGILPEQFVDCKALMGDSSDNIPGVAGIGPKTATTLLSEYGTLDGIYQNIDSIKSNNTKTKLSENKDNAYLSQTLARIVRNAPVELVDVTDEVYAPKATKELCDMLRMLEMNKLLESLKADESENEEEAPSTCIDIESCGVESFVNDIRESGEVSIFWEGTNALVENGCILWTAKNVYTTAKDIKSVVEELKLILEDESISKHLQDIKQLKHIARACGIEINNAAFDYSVAAYLLDAVNWRKDVDYFATKFIIVIRVLFEFASV